MITYAIVGCLIALVFGILFVPGVGSALTMGFGLGMFRAIGENRLKRIKARWESGRGFFGFRRRKKELDPKPDDPAPAPEKTPEQIAKEFEELNPRFPVLQRVLRRKRRK